jgi:hypothetical protein
MVHKLIKDSLISNKRQTLNFHYHKHKVILLFLEELSSKNEEKSDGLLSEPGV